MHVLALEADARVQGLMRRTVSRLVLWGRPWLPVSESCRHIWQVAAGMGGTTWNVL